MSLFVNKDKTHKSPVVMLGFILSFLFAGIFGVLYAVLTKPLYEYVVIAGNAQLSNLVHCLLIAVLGTALCCLFFLLPDKRLVPAGFAFLAVFAVVFALAAATAFDGADRAMLLQMIVLFAGAPVLLGNAIVWSVYLKIRKPPIQGGLL